MTNNRFQFYLDCLISLIAWKILKKTGQNLTTYTLSKSQQFIARRYSMDAVVIYENLIDKVYDDYLPIFHKDDVAVDIGAHIGSFAIHLAQKFPKLRIISVEPMAENLKILKKNIELNRVEKSIHVLPIGIAKKPEKRILYKDPGNTAGHTLYPNLNSLQYYIQCTTLQNLFLQNNISSCTLLKAK